MMKESFKWRKLSTFYILSAVSDAFKGGMEFEPVLFTLLQQRHNETY